MSKTDSQSGRYVARCGECDFEAYGAEAYVRRKGSIHAKTYGHAIAVGQ